MKRHAILLAAALLAGPALSAQQPAPPPKAPAPTPAPPDDKKPLPSLTGKWDVQLDMTMGLSTPQLTLKQDGEKITGTYAGRYGNSPLEGTIKGRTIELFVHLSVQGETVEMAFTGEVAADAESMRGDADLGQAGDGTWKAKRVKS